MKKLHWSDGPINILGFWLDTNQNVMEERNLDDLFKKAQSIVDTWKMRSLSLVGSTIAFNSLIASLFVYRLSCLGTISKLRVKQFNRLAREFVWRGKKPKIALKLLQGPKSEGGLGLCNLAQKDQALKIQWIFKLPKNSSLKNLAYLDMNNVLGDLIWRIQLKPQDLKHLEFLQPSFWTDVLNPWLRHTYAEPISKDQVLAQILWFNSAIRIQNKPIFYKSWLAQGIKTVKDLLDDNHKILSAHQLSKKFQLKIPFTDLWGIYDALPARWKAWLKEDFDGPKFESWFEIYQSSAKVTRTVYQNLIIREFSLEKTVNNWQKLFPCISKETIKQAIHRIYLTTNVPKYRAFHFRIIYNGIITNIALKHFGIKNNDLCSFCGNAPENLLHLFVDCIYVKDLWKEISVKYSIDVSLLNTQNILLNNIEANPRLLPNLIVLLAKFYIYRARCCNEKLHITIFNNWINSIKELEREIAFCHNKLTLHNLKWGMF